METDHLGQKYEIGTMCYDGYIVKKIPIRYLHSIGLARSCLAISKDANMISIYTGCDEWLNFLEHLRDKDQE